MINSGIYLILNADTKKYYIGSAINFKTRLENHLRSLRAGYHPNKYLQASWNKHGEEAFTFHILERVVDKDALIEREQYWMDLTNCCKTGYNLAPKAGNNLGFKFSEESIARLSKAMTGKKYKKYPKRKSRVLTIEARAELSASISRRQLGKKLPESHKKNIAEGMKKSHAFRKSLLTT